MSKTVTITLPTDLYNALTALAQQEKTDPVEVIARLVTQERETHASLSTDDPVLALIGAYQSERALIDGIVVSEDPELYVIADALGAQADGKHAWEIAPGRYRRRTDGSAERHDTEVDTA